MSFQSEEVVSVRVEGVVWFMKKESGDAAATARATATYSAYEYAPPTTASTVWLGSLPPSTDQPQFSTIKQLHS